MKSNQLRRVSYNAIGMAVLGLSWMAAGCGRSNAEAEDKTAEAKAVAAPVYETVALKKGQLTGALRIPGELVAFQEVDLYAKVNSFVKKLYVDVGSEVREGQLLATLEAPEMTAQLSGAESRLQSQEAVYLASKATYERLLETSKVPGTVSPNDLDQALARQKSDLAQLEAARALRKEITDNRNYLEIRAPFSGVITSRNVSVGAYVGPSGRGSENPLFSLVQQDHLRLVVSVPEAHSGRLRASTQVSFSVKAYPDKTFEARIARLSGALDKRLRSQRIEMDVLNRNKQLLPGMVAEVSVPVAGGDDVFLVPSAAILNSPQGIYVIRVKEGTAEWVQVQTGSANAEQTEIFGPLNEGDSLVKVANEEIRNHSEIKTR